MPMMASNLFVNYSDFWRTNTLYNNNSHNIVIIIVII